MTTEQKVLKEISENNGKAPLQLIAKKIGMGHDYIKYLCEILSKKGLVKNFGSKDWYRITRRGWKELKKIEKSIQEYPFQKHISLKKKTKIAERSRKPKKKITKKLKRKSGRKINKKIPKQTRAKTKSPKTKIYPPIAKPRTSVSFAAYQENKITERIPVIREELKTAEPKIEEKVQEEIESKETISPERKFKKLIKGFKNLFHSKK